MTDLYLRFKLGVEVGDNEMEAGLHAHGCRKFFFQGGPVANSGFYRSSEKDFCIKGQT